MARHAAGRPPQFCLHPEARLLVESGRGSLFQDARSLFRHIRVDSKAELKQRILAYLEDLNREAVVHNGPISSPCQPDRSRSLETVC